MRVLLLYEPQEDCVDPLDQHHTPRSHYDLIPENADCLLLWRQPIGDQDADGHLDVHVFGQGVMESITTEEGLRIMRDLDLE